MRLSALLLAFLRAGWCPKKDTMHLPRRDVASPVLDARSRRLVQSDVGSESKSSFLHR